MPFSVKGYNADRPRVVTKETARRAFAKAGEWHGVERFTTRDLGALPATVSGAAARFTCATLQWSGRTVGVLDERMLFQTVARNVA